jgi:hypothetical protein
MSVLYRLTIAWLCNLFDTVVTSYLWVTLGSGGELNPISAWLLSQSVWLFVAVKLGLMSIGLLGCWVGRERRICRALVWVAFVEYLLVAGYYAHELIWAWSYML